jgi:hypothetical protein
MKLSRRRKYDYRDVDPWELKLIRVGQAIWAVYRKESLGNGGYPSEGGPLWEALQTVWRLKREYRAELKIKRTTESAKLRKRFSNRDVSRVLGEIGCEPGMALVG